MHHLNPFFLFLAVQKHNWMEIVAELPKTCPKCNLAANVLYDAQWNDRFLSVWCMDCNLFYYKCTGKWHCAQGREPSAKRAKLELCEERTDAQFKCKQDLHCATPHYLLRSDPKHVTAEFRVTCCEDSFETTSPSPLLALERKRQMLQDNRDIVFEGHKLACPLPESEPHHLYHLFYGTHVDVRDDEVVPCWNDTREPVTLAEWAKLHRTLDLRMSMDRIPEEKTPLCPVCDKPLHNVTWQNKSDLPSARACLWCEGNYIMGRWNDHPCNQPSRANIRFRPIYWPALSLWTIPDVETRQIALTRELSASGFRRSYIDFA